MKIVFLGMGEVAKCTLHLLDQFIAVNQHQIFIIERNNETLHPTVNAFISRGAHYLQRELNVENILTILRDEIGVIAGDLIIDLMTDMDMFHTIKLCLENGWCYLNTCVENSSDALLIHHRNHEKLEKIIAPYQTNLKQATCIFDHGMNPGLISSFVKKGLEDIAKLVLSSRIDSEIKAALENKDSSTLAQKLGLEVLHCSELDDQMGINVPDNIFVNTWSCPGFLIEAEAPLQISWGLHEKYLPPGSETVLHRMVTADTPAWRFKAQSYVPHRQITGMLIPHEEVITLRKFLEKPDYAPTICYVYEINPHTRRCFELGYADAEKALVLTPQTHALKGCDKVGALFILRKNPITHEKKTWSYWCGSILETTDPLFSATVIQVAAGVLSAVKWMIANPRAGIRFPEALPHEMLLEYAAPYLGEIFSAPVDYSPQGTGFENFFVSAFSQVNL